jgi:hypothetical protein
MSEREDGGKPSDVSSNGRHTLKPEPTKGHDEVGEPVEQDKAEGAVEQDKAEDVVEQDKAEGPLEQNKAKDRVEQDKAKDPVEQSIRDRPTYASFGNEGTTASVSAFGRLMQISQYLGHGSSGVYCLDYRTTSEPYFVEDRAQELDDMIRDPGAGFGLIGKDTCGNPWQHHDTRPTLEFQNDRWPRFTFHNQSRSEREGDPGGNSGRVTSTEPPLTIEYFCDDGTVFQHYSWNVPSKLRDSVPTFEFDYELLIRDLDFLEGVYHANECIWDRDSCQAFATSEVHDYCNSRYWVLSPKRKTSLIIGHKIMLTEPEKNEEDNQSRDTKKKNTQEEPVVCLIVSAFVKGVPQPIEISSLKESLCEIDLTREVRDSYKERGTLEVTMTYRLQTVLKSHDLEHARVSTWRFDDFFKKRGDPQTRIRFSSHQQLDRIIRRNLEHILSVCSIPVLCSTTDRTRPYTRPKSTELFKEDGGIVMKGKDLALSNCTSPCTTAGSAARSTMEPTRRHTWHHGMEDKDPPIALTCGDMAGHRVGRLSSL